MVGREMAAQKGGGDAEEEKKSEEENEGGDRDRCVALTRHSGRESSGDEAWQA